MLYVTQKGMLNLCAPNAQLMRFVSTCLWSTEPGAEILVYVAGQRLKSDWLSVYQTE
jgi:hypothetical protein